MKLSDETLMAYADNELDTQARLSVELAMAADPEVARRVARHKALRNELRKNFDGVLNEPVPDRLVQAVRAASSQPRKADVTNLAHVRAAKIKGEGSTRRWSWPEWGAMAASLVLGLVVGYSLLRPGGSEPIVAKNGKLLAEGTLNAALSNQLASDQTPESAVQIGMSFVAKTGNYCRAFAMNGEDSLGGLACREGDAWRIRMLTPNETGAKEGEGYRMAGTTLPPAVVKAAEAQIDGDPLDAAGEVAARDSGWLK